MGNEFIMRRDDVFLHDEALALPPTVKTDWKRRLLNTMTVFAVENSLVGLAANQVGHPWRVMVFLVGGRWLECINPEITWMSEEATSDVERCLSVGGPWRVTRPDQVHLHYEDAHGVRRSVWLKGFEARVAQHEIDHLNGITIADARP